MHKTLHINPDKCTGCLQCEMACSYETTASSRRASRASRFSISTTPAARCPTPARSATRPGACTPARSSDPLDKLTGAKVVNDATCVGCKVCTISCPFGTINYVQETGKVQKCDLCGGEPRAPRPARRRHHLHRRQLDRPRPHAAVGRQAGQPAERSLRGDHHVLGRQDPSRKSDQRHGEVRAAEHDLGARSTSARAAWRRSTSSKRSTRRSILSRRTTRSSGPPVR